MAYVSRAPLTLVRLRDGNAAYVYGGAVVPEGADQSDVDRLLAEGFLASVDEPASAVVESAGGKPAQVAPKAAWVDYAVAQGLDRDQAEDMTKAELVDRFGS